MHWRVFAPDVERLESEYQRLLSKDDLTTEQREEFAHFRWTALREPDEVWRQKTLNGDHRYTLIAEFQPLDRPIWCICLSLFLKGEPSFLFMTVITRNASLVDHYRRGERMSWIKRSEEEKQSAAHPKPTVEQQALDGTLLPAEEISVEGEDTGPTDGLADGWSADEAVRAAMGANRRADDIPADQFGAYKQCLEESLGSPDEVWSISAEVTGIVVEDLEDQEVRLFHFLKHYGAESPGFWYVIVAREVPDEDHLEVLEAFPTRDEELVDRYRQGVQEHGPEPEREVSARVLH